MDVTMRFLTEVSFVGLLGESVPITGEDAFAASTFERITESADATEQINKLELVTRAIAICVVGNGFFTKSGGLRFAALCHESTPLHSSAVERPSALASLATFLMPGLRRQRSMPLM